MDGSAPSEDDIRQALNRVLTQPPLSRSERLSGFLRYIVDETLAGRGEGISGYSIAIDVFKRPESFDPATDSLVRVEAGRLRRRLAEFYRDAGAEDPVEISLPTGGYLPAFKAKEKPPSLLTPSHRGPSVAVFPFQNYSGRPDDQYFADGLTEETTANLARFKDLFVFSRSTTAKLVREGADIALLRRELGVDFVLESSVRKSSQAVRVTTQLIDAATEGHVFAEQFERPCTPAGLFEIQDEIALLVAGRVGDRYGPLGRYLARAGRSGQPRQWETYYWITRFYDYYADHDPKKHLEMREGLERALEGDPGSSDGWAALSTLLLDEYRLHINERPSFPSLDRALEHALLAVTCDPENAFAYQALALAYFYRRDVPEFRGAAERALTFNPGHAVALADMGHCFAQLGEWERALPLVDRAIALNPVHPGWYRMPRSWHFLMQGDGAAAVTELKQAPMPGFVWYHAYLAAAFAERGDEEKAKREIGRVLTAAPDFAENVHRELQLWCKHEALIETLIAAWRKAGLEID